MIEEISIKIDDEEIVFADLINREKLELVAVCKSGNIYLYDLVENCKQFLTKLPFNSVPNLVEDFNTFEVLNNLSSTELAQLLENQPAEVESIESIAAKNQDLVNSLSLNAKLYSFQNYVCLVQNKGVSGVVFDLTNPVFQKRLERGNYEVEHCSFPITFYEKDNQTFLIHGTDWNRLDITCLETNELLTDRSVNYDTKSNYFDYFHSSLLISPNAKHFTSNGWLWGPCDNITIYSVDKFLQEFELSNIQLDFWEVDGYNWDRPLCWMNNQTIGIGYNKKEANENKGNFISEIVFFDILDNKIVNRINFDGFELSEYGAAEGELFYDAENKRFIGLNKNSGLLISDIDGKELFRNSKLTSHQYSQQHKLIYQIDRKKRTFEFEQIMI